MFGGRPRHDQAGLAEPLTDHHHRPEGVFGPRSPADRLGHYDDELVAQRGPYTLDVTYTLERVQEERGPIWRLTRAVYANEPPAWQPSE